MGETSSRLEGSDLTQGVDVSQLAEGGILLGHVNGDAAILVARDGMFHAIGATCTHYGGPLAEGVVVGDTVRCPWHHACFSLHTGEATCAPALDPVACWRVEQQGGKVYVREQLALPPRPRRAATPGGPRSIVIVGGGAAGNAAAEMLRREGYAGTLTLLSADESVPCDRPNLSKNFLAGSAPEEWVPLRSREFYEQHGIDLRLRTRVTALDPRARELTVADGGRVAYDVLLLATGAEPLRLSIPGAELPHVHYLRTLADCRAIIAEARAGRRATVIGASFIGLEVASSLRARNVEVDVVTREPLPMARILGSEVGTFLRRLHEDHGVRFHLGTEPIAIDAHGVTLATGERIESDFVIAGVGVRPAIGLAQDAGLAMDRGIAVNEHLQTSVPDIFAAGDIARWPDPLTGDRIRVEHWVVAERQGQTAARNMLGDRERFTAVPFFWTEQYDFGMAYVGHAEKFDSAEVDGNLEQRDCAISYRQAGRKLAVAVIHRDLDGLRAEVEFERSMAARASADEAGMRAHSP